MMLSVLTLVLAVVYQSQGLPRPQNSAGPPGPTLQQQQQQQQPNRPPYQYIPEGPQYFQYDYPLVEPPQYYNFGNRQPIGRVQPQLFLYHGGAPGQPFLLHPGSPPGNFLLPQPHPQPHPNPGPNVILRDSPQPPILIAGYPKPAHIPPVEKDAEEIPTNPSRIPPMTHGRRPEKIETLDQDNNSANEADVLTTTTASRQTPNLRPGQRFFILNGQSLYPNYPFPNYPQIYNSNPEKFSNQIPNNFLLRNAVTGQIDDVAATADDTAPPKSNQENVVLLNQPEYFSDNQDGSYTDLSNFENLYNSDSGSDEGVVIDVRDRDDDSSESNQDRESEVDNIPEKSAEPTISQAQPGAIALAGPGGVAAAAPRGTAFVGKEGVAISSPQATAVAGPTKPNEPEAEKNKKKEKRKQ